MAAQLEANGKVTWNWLMTHRDIFSQRWMERSQKATRPFGGDIHTVVYQDLELILMILHTDDRMLTKMFRNVYRDV